MRSPYLLLSSLGLVFAGAPHAAPFADGHHDHAASAVAPAQAPAGRWSADASLREGMARVRVALDELRHHEMGHMSDDQARGQAVEIEDAVRWMFAHCRLAPQPDAALHSILIPLLAAAQRLDRTPADKTALAAMRDAVASYPARFDDPQWPHAANATPEQHDPPADGSTP